MFFVVVNKVVSGKGQNVHGIPGIVDEISDPNYNIAKILAVDCASKDEVRENLIIPVLTQMSERIEEADKRLLKDLDELGENLYLAYRAICSQTKNAFVKSVDNDLKREFEPEIIHIVKKMQDELRDLFYGKYNDQRKLPNKDLEDACAQKLRNILLCVPKQEEILSKLKEGDQDQHSVYKWATNVVRLRIITDFTTLNDVLAQIVEKMKREVLDIFCNTGRLGAIVPFKENMSANDWMAKFLETTEAQEKYKLLYEPLVSFMQYEINVQGFIIHEVRDLLDPIDMSLKNEQYILGNLSNKEELSEEIKEIISGDVFELRTKLSEKLNSLYCIPNKSLFAAIKDLYDRITFTDGTVNGKYTTVERQWRYLYEDNMNFVLADEYNEAAGMQKNASEWNDTIRRLGEKNLKEYFTVEI